LPPFLATTGPFAHPHAIRNDLMSAIIALELADLQLARMLFPWARRSAIVNAYCGFKPASCLWSSCAVQSSR